jgi:hypothetical protein
MIFDSSPQSQQYLNPNKDVIHVTLEAASMKQLIKLSQDLIPADQIEAEIEKQSMTLEATGSNPKATQPSKDISQDVVSQQANTPRK